jgi:hypothetical protein
MSWMPLKMTPVSNSTLSMPELWQGSDYTNAHDNKQQHMRFSSDVLQLRDQGMTQSNGQHAAVNCLQVISCAQPEQRSSSESSLPWQQQQQAEQLAADVQSHNSLELKQQQDQGLRPPGVPLEVVLAPLLPSADEAKLADRLSQLRGHLEQQQRLAAFWEQQVRPWQMSCID